MQSTRKGEVIRFTAPAARWEEALPLGNGRLGAMLFGGIGEEKLQLNEESVWYGGPMDRNNPDALANLPRLREAILAGRLNEAREIANNAFSGTPQSMRPYQSLGELSIYGGYGDYSGYERLLDLSEAVHHVHYTMNGYSYEREQFISAPAQVCVFHYKTDCPQGLSMTPLLTRSRYYDYAGKADLPGGSSAKEDALQQDSTSTTKAALGRKSGTIMLGGNLGKGGSDFCMMLRAVVTGGTVETVGERLVIQGAKEVLLLLAAGTTYWQKRAELLQRNEQSAGSTMQSQKIQSVWSDMQNPEAQALLDTLDRATQKSYDQLKQEHIADYRRLYSRVHLELHSKTGADTDFTERYFNFGRYLMISGSRPGTLPLTLQGLWNKDYLPAWDSKYTININTEMNYWPAESCNLSECHLPLFDLLQLVARNGAVTAGKMYNCAGIVAHHNTDVWGDTAVQDIWEPASFWVMGAAWLCTHQWTHYLYTQDREFLRQQYPIMREAAHFFLDFLIEDDGYLKTCPSTSPENVYRSKNGEQGSLTAGCTMDNQILRDLMNQCIRAAKILELEEPLLPEFKRVLERLQPNRIGSRGQLLEWAEEYEEMEPGHRHISHLYGLHPSHQITPDQTPELAAAARTTLERRLKNGGGHTGWSRAWIINMYCRLLDGEAAYQNLLALFEKSTLPNLFDNHPPFQIDGNFGGLSGITEMLVQSSEDRTLILPALPAAWDSGTVSGLKLVGGAELALSWEQGELTDCRVTVEKTLTMVLLYKNHKKTVTLQTGTHRVEFA